MQIPISKTKLLTIGPGYFVIASFAAGCIAGALGGKVYYKRRYAALAETEILEARMYYQERLAMREKPDSPEDLVRDLDIPVMDEETAEEVAEYLEESEDPAEPKLIETNVLVRARHGVVDLVISGEDRSGHAFVISKEEFMENETEYTQTTLTYYEGDDVLADAKDQPIPDSEKLVGDSNLLRFGHGSGDAHIVYVRNEQIGLEFEIIHSEGSYVTEVLGEVRHSDDRRPARRFRLD